MLKMMIIIVGICMTLICLLLSALAFTGKRDLIMNKFYVSASEEERKKMDKKPFLKQTAIFFLLIAAVTALNVCVYIFNIAWFKILSLIVLIITGVYYFVSNKKLIEESNK